MRMKISMIAAVSDNNVIGVGNELPWVIPEDLKWFKMRTRGKTVIMGRKTHESIGRALPGRKNIVITRNSNYQPLGDSVVVVGSFEEALTHCDDVHEVMVIGGEQIYRIALPYAKSLYLTRVHVNIENGDAFFPEFDERDWVKTTISDLHPDSESAYDYEFTILSRS